MSLSWGAMGLSKLKDEKWKRNAWVGIEPSRARIFVFVDKGHLD
jgi:hypothetical protein